MSFCENWNCECHEKKCCEKCRAVRNLPSLNQIVECKNENCSYCHQTLNDQKQQVPITPLDLQKDRYQNHKEENMYQCDKCYIGDLHKARQFDCEDIACGCACRKNSPTPTPHLQWEEKFKVLFTQYRSDEDRDYYCLEEPIKQFIHSLLQERDEMAAKYGNERYSEGITQERDRVIGILEGMKEEDNYSTAYADYTPEKALKNSMAILNYNHALKDAITKVKEGI